MKRVCNRVQPEGYDPKKHKFGQHWVANMMKRDGLSVRRPTNRKKASVFTRLHKVHNYHHYSQYELADDPPSSESEGEDDETPNFVYS